MRASGFIRISLVRSQQSRSLSQIVSTAPGVKGLTGAKTIRKVAERGNRRDEWYADPTVAALSVTMAATAIVANFLQQRSYLESATAAALKSDFPASASNLEERVVALKSGVAGVTELDARSAALEKTIAKIAVEHAKSVARIVALEEANASERAKYAACMRQ
jgi:uncharacterized small protein (DUF1192 family)